jgi:hypothetical protein
VIRRMSAFGRRRRRACASLALRVTWPRPKPLCE